MFRVLRRVACEASTLSPTSRSSTGEVISMAPRVILVAICSVWKKEVFSGPQVVGPGGMMTFTGAMAPTRAGAGTTLAMTTSRTSLRSPLVKTKPTLPTSVSMSCSIGWPSFLATNWPRHLRIMVFLPMRISALPRRAMRTCWICFEPTLSTPTTKSLLYLPSISSIFWKYCSLRSREIVMVAVWGGGSSCVCKKEECGGLDS
mmetsp:Transcript_37823/g.118521  ORF Transcript_37823/g.118521 Transcript_37823/m.118521 type:complete len:203 (-) Transcript_37823:91-699(-)